MAVAGWVLDKSAAVRADQPGVAEELAQLAGQLVICPIGALEQLYSARSATHYDQLQAELHAAFEIVAAPADILERALVLQRDLAHHHGMWHRTPIPDLLIAEVALHHHLGVVHVDGDFDRIAEVRPLTARRLRPSP
ncbi:MAG TPA: PIN domain-containing protein [Actinomycetota bacterium]|nr:PIN domain-containing protein [Actinomycetota bacterium]